MYKYILFKPWHRKILAVDYQCDPIWIHVCSQKVAADSQVLVECLKTWNPNRMPLQIRVANDIWSDFRIFQKRKQAQCMYPLTSLLTGTHGSVVAWSAEGCHRLCWEFPDQRGERKKTWKFQYDLICMLVYLRVKILSARTRN